MLYLVNGFKFYIFLSSVCSLHGIWRETSMNLKEKKKKEIYELVRELYYNKGLSIKVLAERIGKSERTIYRWIKRGNQAKNGKNQKIRKKYRRVKRYPLEVFERIIILKEEIPQRSASMIYRILQKEFEGDCPSLSTIQRFIREKGLVYKPRERSEGYKKFQRDKPNDLWQIDIAGVQTVGYLKQLFLIAILDDCSRFVVAAEYFRTQKGKNVLKVIRDAVITYGRPNQILADRGTQFRNAFGELGTKYSKLLESLDITPIFAKPYHPETKGKLERWFRTVHSMFLIEGRDFVKKHQKCSLADFNEIFKEWISWYNTQKPHNSLPDKATPEKIYLETEGRIFKPLQAKINWDKWLNELEQRKVSKYNAISYKGQNFDVPPGYALTKVDVIEYEDKLELYFKDKLLITHPYLILLRAKKNKVKLRKIRKNGTISYNGRWYTIDYKLASKTVEVQETNSGRTLLVYLDGVLIAKLNL